MTSNHRFFGLSRLLPWTYPFIAILGNRLGSFWPRPKKSDASVKFFQIFLSKVWAYTGDGVGGIWPAVAAPFGVRLTQTSVRFPKMCHRAKFGCQVKRYIASTGSPDQNQWAFTLVHTNRPSVVPWRQVERPSLIDHGPCSADEHSQSPALLFGTDCLNIWD